MFDTIRMNSPNTKRPPQIGQQAPKSRAKDATNQALLHAQLHHLLSSDLDFHDQVSDNASHNVHSFPAKFPPQLPAKFIEALTKTGDTVLDPMMGSGTTVLEACILGRAAIGFDIDPLAVLLAKVKTTVLDKQAVLARMVTIVEGARKLLREDRTKLEDEFQSRWSQEARHFLTYWFAKETLLELLSLIKQINDVKDVDVKTFFEVAFSSTVITKSGGVSLALDLAHTRPHKAKVAYDPDGKVIFGGELIGTSSSRLPHVTKRLRSAIAEFEKRCSRNLASLPFVLSGHVAPIINFADTQKLPIEDNSVDLIVTSPPYASNAIDYMRAHKFSLIWLGHNYHDLSEKRGSYIGGESTREFCFEKLPPFTAEIVRRVASVDERKGAVLHRYFSEMTRALREMYRVIRPGRVSVLVVGNSTMRGIDTQTSKCLSEIGTSIGFVDPIIGERKLDRNRRMLPAGMRIDQSSQIQQRMHKEYVIAFPKPTYW